MREVQDNMCPDDTFTDAHPDTSGVKTQVLLRVSWHKAWKSVEGFPMVNPIPLHFSDRH